MKWTQSSSAPRNFPSLSACAEDHGLCPWMNAQTHAESFKSRHWCSGGFRHWRITLQSLGVGGYVVEVPRALLVGAPCAVESLLNKPYDVVYG